MFLQSYSTIRPANITVSQVIYSRASAIYPSLRVTSVGDSSTWGVASTFLAETHNVSPTLQQRGYESGKLLRFAIASFATPQNLIWCTECGRWCVSYDYRFGGALLVAGPSESP